jgi:hypothetical protein
MKLGRKKMISFRSNKKLEKAFKTAKICSEFKKEGELAKAMINNILLSLDKDTLEKLKYIRDFVNEGKLESIITLAMLIYPDKSLKEAIDSLYNGIKFIEEKYKDEPNEYIMKNFRTDRGFEEWLKNDVGFVKQQIAKAAYLKEAIEAARECDIF